MSSLIVKKMDSYKRVFMAIGPERLEVKSGVAEQTSCWKWLASKLSFQKPKKIAKNIFRVDDILQSVN